MKLLDQRICNQPIIRQDAQRYQFQGMSDVAVEIVLEEGNFLQAPDVTLLTHLSSL